LRAKWDPPGARLQRLGSWSYARRADARIYALLRHYDSVGIFGAHYADLAKRHGVAAWYAPSPVEDPRPSPRGERAPGPPRILLIGHLRGIATISGLHVLVDDVLPRLDAELGREGYEARIVGAYCPPESLRESLQHPAVRLTGAVEPPDEEFLGADVVLVPTPIETGPRVRILTAFAYGCCVVAHRANALGIPELEDGVNVLLADTRGLAAATLSALRDAALRQRLGAAGHALYESRFTPEAAGGGIVRRLEELVARPKRTPSRSRPGHSPHARASRSRR
jgi:glycosyltransferase involved in cell wall biosynthesis